MENNIFALKGNIIYAKDSSNLCIEEQSYLVCENGKVQVHVQRDTERLHLVVMNHEHIAGGSSVYEVINQYSALNTDENRNAPARDRRFDVTLLINGLPMIHIELKNKQHPYMDGFRQIKKYISEGKFTGIFSAVQMFVISNGVDTKYFSADTELNEKFISGWLDKDNNPVTDYIDFAKSVLRIPQAHEMIARYTVLDEDAKKLILLRPYQIHAIESIREASKTGKSGFVWHTTGSGKTLTSYKATRNLLMDIPSIQKTIFLIDRKDLDLQTKGAFQSYADNDTIDVDDTEHVGSLIKKLADEESCVIVGRCADYALADYPNVVSVFICADEEVKIQELMKRHNITRDKAKDVMIKTDKQRSGYYNYYSSKRWGSSKSYNLCINSSVVGIDGAVEIIKEFAKKKQEFLKINENA